MFFIIKYFILFIFLCILIFHTNSEKHELYVNSDIQLFQDSPKDTIRKNSKEYFGFTLDLNIHKKDIINWDILTTLIVSLPVDLMILDEEERLLSYNETVKSKVHELVEVCHKKRVKIVPLLFWKGKNQEWFNITRQDIISSRTIQIIKDFQFDGVNLDFEMVIENQTQADNMVSWTYRITSLVRLEIGSRNSHVSIDVQYKPEPFIDYFTIGTIVDYMILMAYDMGFDSSRVMKSNSPQARVQQGARDYIYSLGIEPGKVIMALPYYGYTGKCVRYNMGIFSSVCEYGDNKLNSIAYSNIINHYVVGNLTNSGILYDTEANTPYVNHIGKDGSLYQTHFDSPASLYYKIRGFHMGGVAVYRLEFLLNLPKERVLEFWISTAETNDRLKVSKIQIFQQEQF